jgi:hypothetical protein
MMILMRNLSVSQSASDTEISDFEYYMLVYK